MTKTTLEPQLDVAAIRRDFPILQQTIHNQRSLIYFDNAASSQHPHAVIDAMTRCYETRYANVHRGIHYLSEAASADFEQSRQRIAQFLNVIDPYEVVFTSGTTAGINLIARSWGEANLAAGDEILLTIFEHHSNIVPWQQLAARTGAKIVWCDLPDGKNFDLEHWRQQLSPRTKLVSFAAVSNVLGCALPVMEMIRLAHAVGAVAVVDAAQHVAHHAIDVEKWQADFVVFSGHKMLGPSGIGALYGRRALLEAMPPFLGGGSMIRTVTQQGFTPGELPAKFEAGTPPIVEAIGLGAAVEYLQQFSWQQLHQHDLALGEQTLAGLQEIPEVELLGAATPDRSGIFSFHVPGVSAQDLAVLLDRQGIAVRAGHHCAMPLHDRLKIPASVRASFYLYNTAAEVEEWLQVLKKVIAKLK